MLNCLNTSKESYHLWCMARVGHQMEAVHYNLTTFHYFPVFLSHESICFQDPVDKMTVHYLVVDGIWIKKGTVTGKNFLSPVQLKCQGYN